MSGILRRNLLLAAGLLALAGCGSPATQPAGGAAKADDGPRRGGRVVAALGSEPRTFNPVTAADGASLSVIQAMTANLVHIDRQDQEAKPALAERWTVDDGGRRYTLVLRPALRFSDGHPATADDVVFSFQVYLDEKIDSPQRDLLIVGGQPIQVRRIDDRTVEFRLAEPYGVAERLFDGFAILPRHLLEAAYKAGTLADAWGTDTPPAKMAGLGPFRLRERRAGERLVLERNPFYWKKDKPYLDELVFLTVPNADAQAVRFQAGELDVVDRLSAESFDRLSRGGARRGYQLTDAGPGLDLNFLFFNQNDLGNRRLPELRRRQGWFRQTAFRQAVSAAIDRGSLVHVVYRGRATPLNSHETPGSHWLNKTLPPPRYAPDEARRLLRQAGFSWDAAGALHDPAGERVGFTLLVVAGNTERGPMATLIQEDLRKIGMDVRIAALELQAVLDRLFTSYDYDACVLGLDGGDADPNPSMSILLSDGSHHFWGLTHGGPPAPWEAEIDRLMKTQIAERDPAQRRRLYDRVQEIVMEQRPLIALVTPNVLVGAKAGLGNLRPAVLDDHLLWNVEELYWRQR
ncbi:MAG: peptide/nickel transport system substrate-binding protein [Acidobacteriota bacterium]|jgi:peptide/nickel transport system substrate-binding protein|nr:peptide/nickel transport system substrate-binding protein [Acidobacteriota bacterium]